MRALIIGWSWKAAEHSKGESAIDLQGKHLKFILFIFLFKNNFNIMKYIK